MRERGDRGSKASRWSSQCSSTSHLILINMVYEESFGGLGMKGTHTFHLAEEKGMIENLGLSDIGDETMLSKYSRIGK